MLGYIYPNGQWITWVIFDVPPIQSSPHKKHPDIMIYEAQIGDKIKPVRVDYPSTRFSIEQVTELASKWSIDIEAEKCPRCRPVDQIDTQDDEPWSIFPILERPSFIEEARTRLNQRIWM